MERSGLLKELQKLTLSERLAIIEAALQQPADMEGAPESKPVAVRKKWPPPRLCKRITPPGELTAFIALDISSPECGARD